MSEVWTWAPVPTGPAATLASAPSLKELLSIASAPRWERIIRITSATEAPA